MPYRGYGGTCIILVIRDSIDIVDIEELGGVRLLVREVFQNGTVLRVCLLFRYLSLSVTHCIIIDTHCCF